jgi:hypothetical protein
MMPKIDINLLDGEAKKFAAAITAARGKNKGRLRASKPPVEYDVVDKNGRRIREPRKASGEIAYVWRMVAFQVSPIGQHQCLPMTADFNLQGTCEERRQRAKELDSITDQITNTIPKAQHYGTMRWGRIFGAI